MRVADVLAPNKHQVISNHHADSLLAEYHISHVMLLHTYHITAIKQMVSERSATYWFLCCGQVCLFTVITLCASCWALLASSGGSLFAKCILWTSQQYKITETHNSMLICVAPIVLFFKNICIFFVQFLLFFSWHDSLKLCKNMVVIVVNPLSIPLTPWFLNQHGKSTTEDNYNNIFMN